MRLSAYAPVLRIVGVLLIFISLGFVPPLVFALVNQDGAAGAFLVSLLVVTVTGLALFLPTRKAQRDLRISDGFLVVVACWAAVCLAGAIPFVIGLDASLADAVFESTSGITTTGATVFSGIAEMPISIRWYRQQLQWMGGLGIIILAVAILPMLRVGGMQVYKAEATGPVKESRLTPRIAETAKALWAIYIGLTLVCAAAYWAAGMSLFDAMSHSFSTVATAGFSTHDASIGHFDSALIESVAVVFMLLGGMNFALHFLVFRRASFAPYRRDEEVRLYLVLLGAGSAIGVAYLLYAGVTGTVSEALRWGIFHAVSIGTTTGYATTDFYLWPGFLPLMLVFLSFVGGCTASTGGGMKVIRVLLLGKQGLREIQRLIHPHAHIAVKVNQKVMPNRVVEAVWGFMAAYILVFAVMVLLLMASGLDQVTSFSAVAGTLNNLGPGLGEVGPNYSSINDFSKWVLVFAMLLGRLEIFTVLVLLSPAFWRR